MAGDQQQLKRHFDTLGKVPRGRLSLAKEAWWPMINLFAKFLLSRAEDLIELNRANKLTLQMGGIKSRSIPFWHQFLFSTSNVFFER